MYSRRAETRSYLFTPESTPVKSRLIISSSLSRPPIVFDPPKPVRRSLARKPYLPPPASVPARTNQKDIFNHPVDIILSIIALGLYEHLYTNFYAIVLEELRAPTVNPSIFYRSLPNIKLFDVIIVLSAVATAVVRLTLGFGLGATKQLVNTVTQMFVFAFERAPMRTKDYASGVIAQYGTEIRQLWWDTTQECAASAIFLTELMVLCVFFLWSVLHALLRHLGSEWRHDPHRCMSIAFAFLGLIVVAAWRAPEDSYKGAPVGLFLAISLVLLARWPHQSTWATLWFAVTLLEQLITPPFSNQATPLPTPAPSASTRATAAAHPPSSLHTPSPCPRCEVSSGWVYPPSPPSLRKPRHATCSPRVQIQPSAHTLKPPSSNTQALGHRADELHRMLADCSATQLESVNRLVVGMQARARARAEPRTWRM